VKRAIYGLAVAACVALAIVGYVVMRGGEEEEAPRAGIVMLGDSLTAGGDWKVLLDRPDVANHGIPGDTVRGVIARVPEVVALRPEVVVVMIGINDLLSGRAVDEVAAEHAELIRQLAPRARVIVQTLLPVRDVPVGRHAIAVLNEKLVAACAANACELVDIGRAMTGPDGKLAAELTTDGLHLTEAGYRRWRDVLGPRLPAARR